MSCCMSKFSSASLQPQRIPTFQFREANITKVYFSFMQRPAREPPELFVVTQLHLVMPPCSCVTFSASAGP